MLRATLLFLLQAVGVRVVLKNGCLDLGLAVVVEKAQVVEMAPAAQPGSRGRTASTTSDESVEELEGVHTITSM